ncbi:MAG TPA: WYL domain-containing transcriptional regulator, partial [Candidatus Limnocylindrales bacterium]|nr:WYL domain-containing transcriptional regulator [Candidatus Limnocylindrales bacterium]
MGAREGDRNWAGATGGAGRAVRGDPEAGSPWEAHGGVKWDKAARYLKTAMILHAHPDGMSAADLARQVGVSVRTTYRDLEGLDQDAGLPVWQSDGRWGLEEGAFLPPLALTLGEAMTLFLAARILARASDEQDTELVGAFVKLAGVLPPVLAGHIQATADASADTPANARFTRVFRTLTEAWAGRRVVVIDYDAGAYDPSRTPRRTRVRPYLIEPSALTHALYLVGFDEERGAQRTFKVERILEASLTSETFEPNPDFDPAAVLRRAWDIIADEPMVEVRLRFSPSVAKRVAETRWHPSQVLEPAADGSLVWRARVSGTREIRIWILGWGADVEVLAPA